jgi:hypothetical protein
VGFLRPGDARGRCRLPEEIASRVGHGRIVRSASASRQDRGP